jgi:hypothetical protein
MLRVFVRHCNFSQNSVSKGRPSFFSKEVCFNNLLRTKKQETEVTVFFDGTPEKNSFLNNKDIKIVSKICGSDSASFSSLLDYITSLDINPEDNIYLLEDDYLHKPGWDTVLEEGLNIFGIDYVTLYDCPDKYFYTSLAPDAGYETLVSKIYLTKSSHWRTTPSTTNTYAMKYKTLLNDFSIHKKYCSFSRITLDHFKFLELNKERKRLVSALPGWSTHVVEGYMSPIVDWEQYK